MRRSIPFCKLSGLMLLSLSVFLMGLAGCSSGSYSPSIDTPVPLPADATYDKSVTSAGFLITDLGPGRVAAINTSSQVLGTDTYAYLWEGGRRHYLGVLGGDKGGSEAVSLNDSGQVLGFSYGRRQIAEVSAGPKHPFVWQDGAFTPISANSTSSSFEYIPIKINNAGQALIMSYSSPVDNAPILWQNGQITPVTAIGMSGKPLSIVSINNNGTLLGYGYDSPEQFTDIPFPSRSYLVQNGQVTDLGFLPNRLNTRAVVVNDNNQIVGTGFSYNVDDPTAPPQPFLWQNGRLTVLSGLAGDYGINGLNSSGFMVGWIQDASTARRFAFRYELATQTLTDLDATIGKSAGWQLTGATAINDKGQIIGEGYHNGQVRSFLLSIPPGS